MILPAPDSPSTTHGYFIELIGLLPSAVGLASRSIQLYPASSQQ